MKDVYKTIKIRSYEIGLHFRDGEFKGLLGAGRHWFFDPLGKVKVEVVSQRAPWLAHEKLDVIVKSGALKDRAVVLDLKDYERALVWVDGRFSHILPPGLYAYWTTFREVAVEVIDARKVRFEHKDLQVIVRSAMADRLLDAFAVEQGHVGVLFEDGRYVETLPPGKYAFWKNMAKVMLVPVDLRETMLDIGGQEIMTADKVTLRLNAVATYRVADAHKALSAADDARQALYREAQLALRAVIGGRELDQFLADKDAVAKELEEIVRAAGGRVGSGGHLGRHPRRDPAGRHEGPDEQGHGGQEGGRGQPDRPPRGDGGHAQPGQHGQGAGGQPDADAAPGAGSPGAGGHQRQAERRAGREGPGRAGREPALIENDARRLGPIPASGRFHCFRDSICPFPNRLPAGTLTEH